MKFCLAMTAIVIFPVIDQELIFAQQTKQAKPAQKSAAKQTMSKEDISEARILLDSLGYWVVLDVAGTDASLRHAMVAFQKIEGRKITGLLTQEELQALRVATRPEVLESGYPHIEVDLTRQVLFVVECGDVPLRILPISSGSGEWFTEGGFTRQAITPTGRFKINRQIEGWRKSALGLLYYPCYFYGGYAIHGNPLVPTTPASHGCIRIPMFAAKQFSELATVGTDVNVYDDSLPEP